MYSLHLAFGNKSKRIRIPSNINTSDLGHMIEHSFKLSQNVIGFTNNKGQFYNLQQILQSPLIHDNNLLFLVTAQELNEDNMSFASDRYEKKTKYPQNDHNNKREYLNNKKEFLSHNNNNKYHHDNKQKIDHHSTQQELNEIPSTLQGFYKGVIGNLQAFEELFLEDNQATVVFCFVKEKPKNINFPYYLYHTSKNSVIIYMGHNRVCEFFIDNMAFIPKQIEIFIRSIIKTDEKLVYNNNDNINNNNNKNNNNNQMNNNLINHINNPNNNEKQDDFLNDQNEDDQNEEQLNQNQLQRERYNETPYQEDRDQHNNNQDDRLINQQQDDKLVNIISSQQSSKQQTRKQLQIKSSLLENLMKLRDDEEITELEFYKMKSELLESISDFMRKYQMGTRKGFRKHNNFTNQNNINHEIITKNQKRKENKNQQIKDKNKEIQRQRQRYGNRQYQRYGNRQPQRQRKQVYTPQSKNQYRPTYSRQTKKYQIPIIVRKYNNVIQKISTSYPLTQEQEQAINLILELELKGLISEKESGIYKTSILQEDPDTFPLFLDYFDGLIDQIELVSCVKKAKKVNSEKKQRGEHNMRLLTKYAKQSSYEVLRTLLLERDPHLINTLEKYRLDRNVDLLQERLYKLAEFQKQKLMLENILN